MWEKITGTNEEDEAANEADCVAVDGDEESMAERDQEKFWENDREKRQSSDTMLKKKKKQKMILIKLIKWITTYL